MIGDDAPRSTGGRPADAAQERGARAARRASRARGLASSGASRIGDVVEDLGEDAAEPDQDRRAELGVAVQPDDQLDARARPSARRARRGPSSAAAPRPSSSRSGGRPDRVVADEAERGRRRCRSCGPGRRASSFSDHRASRARRAAATAAPASGAATPRVTGEAGVAQQREALALGQDGGRGPGRAVESASGRGRTASGRRPAPARRAGPARPRRRSACRRSHRAPRRSPLNASRAPRRSGIPPAASSSACDLGRRLAARSARRRPAGSPGGRAVAASRAGDARSRVATSPGRERYGKSWTRPRTS